MLGRFRNAANAALAIAFCCAPGLAVSADFDGSDSVAGEACARGLPQSVGAPQFMRVDFAKKTIAGPNRTTPIVSLNKSERQILLQASNLATDGRWRLTRRMGRWQLP
jgi:hypothetical protein